MPTTPTETIAIAINGDTIHIDVLPTRWHDERTSCQRAHQFLAGQQTWIEIDDAIEQCPFYQRAPIGPARCTINGRDPIRTGPGRNPCLFEQDLDTPDWSSVRAWRLLQFPDGSTAVCRARDAQWLAAGLTEDPDAPVIVLGHIALVDAIPAPASYYTAGL